MESLSASALVMEAWDEQKIEEEIKPRGKPEAEKGLGEAGGERQMNFGSKEGLSHKRDLFL